MNSLIKHIGIGVGLGTLTYFVIKKHCTADMAASSGTDTGLSSDLTGGAGGGGGIPDLSGASLSDNANTGTSNGLVTAANPNTTVISTPPSSTTINNAPVGTTNTTTIGSVPNQTPIVQPSQQSGSNNKIVNNPQPALPPISKAPPIQVSVPVNNPCAPGWIRMPDGLCHLMVDSKINNPPLSMNTGFIKAHGAIYPGVPTSRFADGIDISLLPDKVRNFYLGFGKLN